MAEVQKQMKEKKKKGDKGAKQHAEGAYLTLEAAVKMVSNSHYCMLNLCWGVEPLLFATKAIFALVVIWCPFDLCVLVHRPLLYATRAKLLISVWATSKQRCRKLKVIFFWGCIFVRIWWIEKR